MSILRTQHIPNQFRKFKVYFSLDDCDHIITSWKSKEKWNFICIKTYSKRNTFIFEWFELIYVKMSFGYRYPIQSHRVSGFIYVFLFRGAIHHSVLPYHTCKYTNAIFTTMSVLTAQHLPQFTCTCGKCFLDEHAC